VYKAYYRASKSPWITPYLKQRMHDRDILKIKAFSSNDPADWHAFKRTHNIVSIGNSMVSSACLSKLHEKPCYYLLIIYTKMFETIVVLT
jgi:hypothetical protein